MTSEPIGPARVTRFGKMRKVHQHDGPKVFIYGEITDDGLLEKFATCSAAGGPSENLAGTLHSGPYEEIPQAEYNAAFLSPGDIDDFDEEDRTMSLDELKAKYPDEED